MPKFRRYHCYQCGHEDDFAFPEKKKPPMERPCQCGGKMKYMFCGNIHIDDWSPMTNDAQRDIEHFEKKAIRNGKYVDKRSMYREDRMKKDIPVNIEEV